MKKYVNIMKRKHFRSITEENAATDLSDPVIEQCKLYQNAPNPFIQETQIKYLCADGCR